DLQQQVGLRPHVVYTGDARSGRLVRVVGERAPHTRARLDGDLVPALHELARARGRQCDAVLVRLDLFGDADLHGGSPYLVHGLRLAEVEQQPRERLCVFDLAEALGDLVGTPADELELLVVLWACVTALDALRNEDVHVLAAETWCREEG